MHDIRFLRENPAAFDAGLARRGLEPLSAELLALDEPRRATKTALQQGQARRNEASKAIGQATAQNDMATPEAPKAGPDRKRVGSGKGVAGRVVCGGPRHLDRTKTQESTT